MKTRKPVEASRQYYRQRDCDETAILESQGSACQTRQESSMCALKKNIHSTAMAIGSKLTGLLPDKVPVTFVGVDAARRPSVSFD